MAIFREGVQLPLSDLNRVVNSAALSQTLERGLPRCRHFLSRRVPAARPQLASVLLPLEFVRVRIVNNQAYGLIIAPALACVNPRALEDKYVSEGAH